MREEYQNERKEYLLFKDFKNELAKHDISIALVKSLTDVIRIFKELNFEPIKILGVFSDINVYLDMIDQNNSKLKELKSYIHDLEVIVYQNEIKLESKQAMVQTIKGLEDFGFTTLELQNLNSAISALGEKYGLNKTEIKKRLFSYITRFDNCLSLEKDITNKSNTSAELDNGISVKRKIAESQPQLFNLLQQLLNQNLNEYDILNVLKIFISDLMNNRAHGNNNYFEDLSKNLKEYRTIKDASEALKTTIVLKESNIKKLTLKQSTLEVFCRLQLANIYFNFMILNVQMQIQTKFKIILIMPNPLLFFLLVKDSKISGTTNYKEEEQNNKHNKKNKETRKINKKKV